MAKLCIVNGNIARHVKVDAVLSFINPQGMWFGEVDDDIRIVAGSAYHMQIVSRTQRQGQLKDGETIIARGSRCGHAGSFNNVCFIADYGNMPRNELIFQGLMSSVKEGYKTIAIPFMSNDKSTLEKDVEDMVNEIVSFLNNDSEKQLEIIYVVTRDINTVPFFITKGFV